MSVSRRTTLAMLGLAPSTVVGAETFLPPIEGRRSGQAGRTSDKVIAAALRRLAENIEGGTVSATGIEINAAINPNAIVEHALTIRFSHNPEAV